MPISREEKNILKRMRKKYGNKCSKKIYLFKLKRNKKQFVKYPNTEEYGNEISE